MILVLLLNVLIATASITMLALSIKHFRNLKRKTDERDNKQHYKSSCKQGCKPERSEKIPKAKAQYKGKYGSPKKKSKE
tara:strand:- start:52202 stop:52438 length:237 start_codon:yes stop_codon:yes gene_type:complete